MDAGLIVLLMAIKGVHYVFGSSGSISGPQSSSFLP
ncbi:hypothetical protein Cycma_0854 [Cyclobacterium marinum DSM 745]|uniref:Uncharacterized protein n=1 Tax=Cyclobacterium marinum (strain ATCC 25205 / DSM 745 / LMG 13164 / NCIMB 1802) TaxID=880070 RepID=G0J3I8_CYCMS|nr:hypothetical protein Cycma_0854 [Cyclobacterium marinum DSM 745]